MTILYCVNVFARSVHTYSTVQNKIRFWHRIILLLTHKAIVRVLEGENECRSRKINKKATENGVLANAAYLIHQLCHKIIFTIINYSKPKSHIRFSNHKKNILKIRPNGRSLLLSVIIICCEAAWECDTAVSHVYL